MQGIEAMGAIAGAVRQRHNLGARLQDARKRTDQLFAIVRDEAMYDRPISERHRIIFYVGHLEAFDWNLLADRAFGLNPFNPEFDKLFSFGIDPVGGGLPTDVPADWPQRDEVSQYVRQVREKLDDAIEEALSQDEGSHPQLRNLLETAIEHRLMHAETLAYMLHRLPSEKKAGDTPVRRPAPARIATDLIEIPAGNATLGLQQKTGDEFGWDNEKNSHEVFVPAFSIEKCNVINRDFMRFIEAGGYKTRALWDDASWNWKEAEHIEAPTFWRAKAACGCIAGCLANSSSAGLAGIRESRGSHRIRKMARTQIAKRRAISPRRVRQPRKSAVRSAIISLGQ